MTTPAPTPCALCGRSPTTLTTPNRRTLDRGPDPQDDSYNITVILPDIPLCGDHANDVRDGDLHLGWCDDARCRMYGEAGELSACGAPYGSVASGNRSKSTHRRH